MKHRLTLLLLIALILSVGAGALAPVPARAAPQTSMASLMPADTTVYFDLRTDDLDATLNSLLGYLRRADIPVPNNIYAELEKQLSAQFKRPVTFKDDIYSWFSGSLAVGVTLTPDVVAGKAGAQPDILAALAVKDSTASFKFFSDLFKVLEKNGLKFTNKDVTFQGDSQSVLYTNSILPYSLLLSGKYVLIGSAKAVDAAITGGPSLDSDTKYQQVMGMLPGTPTARLYLSGSFYSLLIQRQSAALNAATRPNIEAMTKILDGIAMGLRGEGKLLALDVAEKLNLTALKEFAASAGQSAALTGLQAGLALGTKPLSLDLIQQVPTEAVAVLFGANLAGYYTQIKDALTAASKMSETTPSLNLSKVEQDFTNFESGLKENLNIDINDDVLSWLGGELALYMTYNKTSELAVASKNQWPFDNTLIVHSTDATKTKTFIDKVSNFFDQAASKPVTMGPGLLAFQTQSPVRVGVGLVKDTFILSTGTGIVPAADAVNGKNTLDSDAVWKRAAVYFVKNPISVGYVDLTKVAIVLGTLEQNGVSGSAAAGLRLLSEFESAILSGGRIGDDGVVASFGIVSK